MYFWIKINLKLSYLAAATATALERKQFRVSLPPNPPPTERKKEKNSPILQ